MIRLRFNTHAKRGGDSLQIFGKVKRAWGDGGKALVGHVLQG